ncbi:MAG: PIG-L family deacetylase [Planctomycetes bacterium]|nr:PIG-L family deacetylase [Planctomycetota bacterium]
MFGRRILILIPHPDDEVVGCCAAIGRARAAGAAIYGAYLTTGVPVVEALWPWQRKSHAGRVARRLREAERAAKLLGLEPAFWQDIPTRRLKESMAATWKRLIEFLRYSGANTLWTPAYEGGHQDHDVANYLARKLRDFAEVWEFSEYNYFGGRVRSQEFIFTTGVEWELGLEDAEAERKREALAIYESELSNLRHVCTEHEVFRPLAAYDYGRSPHTGKLFYQRFQWVPYHPRVDYTRPEEVCRALQSFSGH